MRERERLEQTIPTRIAIDMNENGMQISEDTMATIELDMVIGASQRSLEAVRDWFNSKNIAQLPEKEQRRYVGAVVNLLLLVATNDVEGLVKDWVLNGLQ
jgi:hypothetical protein